MLRALFLDFYGTVVHGADALVPIICQQIEMESELRTEISTHQIREYWMGMLFYLFTQSHGDDFKTQGDLELMSIQQTLSRFASNADPLALSQILLDHWRSPAIYQDSLDFLHAVKLPVYILSNIDRSDIMMAIALHSLSFAQIITSEDVRSYKPRSEMFHAALRATGLEPQDILHVGDSLSGDVVGACRMGIPFAWINRIGKTLRSECIPSYVIRELTDIMSLLPS